MKTQSIEDLNRLYNEAEEVDKPIFAEQRSNILLIAGDHYTKQGAGKAWDRIRENNNISQSQRLRLTQNHIQKIHRHRVGQIVSMAPGVMAAPANPKELSDIKVAEMHNSVLRCIKEETDAEKLVQEWVESYEGIGEVAVKIYWDLDAGKIKNMIQEPQEDGSVITRADFTGGLLFEEIYGFNLLRPKDCKDIQKAPWLCVRKMAELRDLKFKLKDQPDKLKLLEPSEDKTFIIFDANSGGYSEAKNQVLLREFYWRPTPEMPMGWYSISTEAGELWSGELPYGIFPIHYEGNERIPTSARHRSPLKHARPVQAEINRTASKIAEHQISLGDDKIITQAGAKVSQGSQFPGIRSIQVSGPQPSFLPGRSGEQYVPHMEKMIDLLYFIMDVPEREKEAAQQDAYVAMLRSARQRSRYNLPAQKFQGFLKRVFKTALQIYKKSVPEDVLIKAVGKSEYINIAEFKSMEDLGYEIKLEKVQEDVDSMFGRQLVMNHVMQYASQHLTKDDIGKLIKNMPLANVEESFEDFTMNYDDGTNVLLALDRGEWPAIHKYDDHDYLLKRLVSRTRKSDFSTLHPQIQQMYEQRIMLHEQAKIQQQREILAAQSQYIPTDGYLVTCDFYAPDPKKPGVTKRVRLPYNSLKWLITQLEAQGASLEDIEMQQTAVVAEMSRQMIGQQGQPYPNTQGGVNAGGNFRTGQPDPTTPGVFNGVGPAGIDTGEPGYVPEPGTSVYR